MKITISFVILIYLSFTLGFSQTPKDSLLKILDNPKLPDTTKANIYKDFIYENYLDKKTDSAYAMILDLLDYTNTNGLIKQKADALILMGDIEHIFGENNKALTNFNKSLKLYQQLDNLSGQAKALNGIGISYKNIYNLDEAKKYYEESLNLSTQIKDTLLMQRALMNIGNIYSWRYKSDIALNYFNQSLKLAKNIKEQAVIYVNIASAYRQQKDFIKAKTYINTAIKIGDSLKNLNILGHAHRGLGVIFFNQKKYNNIISPAQKTLKYGKLLSDKKMIDGAYYLLYEAYKGKKVFDSTIKYINLRKTQRTTIDDLASVKTFERIKIDNTRYKDSLVHIANELKLEIQNEKEKSNMRLAWGGSLSTVSILAFLIFKNLKRKQRIAEEERQKQIEEKEKILKDLELQTIDAMIQGQEKERERLAADLHDSVGATLSAAKLQFEHLVKTQKNAEISEELIKKTSTLLEDAYVEIRSMAHLKNSGVMAKNGLLPAVEKLSKNASGINGLSFEVQSFGLEQRLENSLEITIFRIIQELVTNIIKHANATKGIVHLTNHEDNLNIMIEDNGIGFNPKQVTKINSGMGISSIDKRIEHLDGTLTIESEKNEGTTVIIDIPL
ncbi:tetratricopeptide repeat-containing sensor histidine kinase [Winogradskyella flava]|uniref:Oxygen sensor histidine kinase NreB n=1 Tax=Winogradskyella flava TaxID=1884876 RepID=A0A842IS58_9FLAO|nr:sensor histidine kinase [Winogradskyella flava]MBC2845595.1 sensor histidine kinase [Winogradskyella flava]